MELGDLKTFLRKSRRMGPIATNSNNYTSIPLPIPIRPVEEIAIEIADGMSYIADKKFIHRDLASRNCMVAADLTVKIGEKDCIFHLSITK
jgi:serine/threonine protein kinase